MEGNEGMKVKADFSFLSLKVSEMSFPSTSPISALLQYQQSPESLL